MLLSSLRKKNYSCFWGTFVICLLFHENMYAYQLKIFLLGFYFSLKYSFNDAQGEIKIYWIGLL